jgi:DNA-directed RNA polymerase specialized sigma24 family protein
LGRLELDELTSRGSSGSGDNAKAGYLGRFDPAPAEEREAANARIRAVWSKLSPRQKKYLVGKAKGLTNTELARRFGIAPGSVGQIAEYIRQAAGCGEVTR